MSYEAITDPKYIKKNLERKLNSSKRLGTRVNNHGVPLLGLLLYLA